ncbi:uncharacterized protein LOC121622171 isoform X1 [Chelmon rostratus]|uniref:uncharacterized protein LOC121622171 isoform X1 n=1 Tax=Chelmon rostratus TaxID=109905 RepID=UPI001BE9C9C9|nr:uncharacterized protein LOC121622171 isoform X1 [Chelmon rostratus]
MSLLLEKIRSTDRDAARVLEREDLRTDSSIQSLTKEDLRDLFPGPEKFRLRKAIFEMIQEQKPVDVLISKLKASNQHESLRAALNSSGTLLDYLNTLKDMKTQMNNIQGFLDAHIELLEEFTKHQPDKEWEKASSLPGTSASDTHALVVSHSDQSGGYSQEAQGSSFATSSPQNFREVIYQVVVSGKTFGADVQLMRKVLKSQFQDQVEFVESSTDHQVTVLLCPICSRIGSDVDAAVSEVKDDKPVILVLMHHTHEPRHTTSVRTWAYYPKIVFHVNVFFHDTMNGLLSCAQNDIAVSSIQNKLLEYSTPRPQQTIANPHRIGMGAGSGRTGSSPVRGGGSNSDSGGGNYFTNWFQRGK